MATKLEELFIELSAKTEKLDKGMAAAVKTIEAAEKKITNSTKKTKEKTKKDFSLIGSAAAVMGGIIGGNIVLGAFRKLISIVSTSFQGLRKFSGGIAEINTLLPKNAKLTRATTKEFIKYSSLYGKGLETQTRAFYDIVSAGIKGTADQLEVLNQANVSAVAGLTEVSVAADVLTSVMNSYASANMSASEISDILFQTVKEGKTTFGALAGSIGVVAPLASTAGLSFAELAGTLGFLTKSGLDTREAVTGVRAILTQVIKPADEARKTAKSLGLEFSTAAIKSKGLAGFMKDVAEKTKGSEEALAKLFPNVRALGPILQIVNGNLEDYDGILKNVTNSQGAASEAAKVIKNSLDFKLDRATESLKNFGVVAMSALTPLIKIGADVVAAFFSPIEKWKAGSVTEIEMLSNSIEQLQKQLAVSEKAEADGGFIDKLLGNSGDLKNKIAELEDVRAEMLKLQMIQEQSVGAKTDGGGGTDTKVFTESQKEMAKVGAETAASLIESSQSVDEAFDASLAKISTNLEQKKAEIQAQKDEEVITVADSIEAIQELEDQAFEAKLEAEAERMSATKAQLDSAREQELIDKETHSKSLEQLAKNHLAVESKTNADHAKRDAQLKKMMRDQELKDRQTFLSTAASLASAENKKLAAIGKAAAITQIMIKTPPAIASSFEFGTRMGGPILGGVFAGIAGIAMAVQMASVAGVPLKTGITEVPPGFNNDTFPANLTSGERVVNVQQNQDLTEFLEGQKGGGGGMVFNLNVQGDITDSDENALKIVEAVRQFLRDNGGDLLGDNSN